ncbi:MAG: hypothetical protein AAB724_01815 [Patescibacteria group bacterium]
MFSLSDTETIKPYLSLARVYWENKEEYPDDFSLITDPQTGTSLFKKPLLAFFRQAAIKNKFNTSTADWLFLFITQAESEIRNKETDDAAPTASLEQIVDEYNTHQQQIQKETARATARGRTQKALHEYNQLFGRLDRNIQARQDNIGDQLYQSYLSVFSDAETKRLWENAINERVKEIPDTAAALAETQRLINAADNAVLESTLYVVNAISQFAPAIAANEHPDAAFQNLVSQLSPVVIETIAQKTGLVIAGELRARLIEGVETSGREAAEKTGRDLKQIALYQHTRRTVSRALTAQEQYEQATLSSISNVAVPLQEEILKIIGIGTDKENAAGEAAKNLNHLMSDLADRGKDHINGITDAGMEDLLVAQILAAASGAGLSAEEARRIARQLLPDFKNGALVLTLNPQDFQAMSKPVALPETPSYLFPEAEKTSFAIVGLLLLNGALPREDETIEEYFSRGGHYQLVVSAGLVVFGASVFWKQKKEDAIPAAAFAGHTNNLIAACQTRIGELSIVASPSFSQKKELSLSQKKLAVLEKIAKQESRGGLFYRLAQKWWQTNPLNFKNEEEKRAFLEESLTVFARDHQNPSVENFTSFFKNYLRAKFEEKFGFKLRFFKAPKTPALPGGTVTPSLPQGFRLPSLPSSWKDFFSQFQTNFRGFFDRIGSSNVLSGVRSGFAGLTRSFGRFSGGLLRGALTAGQTAAVGIGNGATALLGTLGGAVSTSTVAIPVLTCLGAVVLFMLISQTTTDSSLVNYSATRKAPGANKVGLMIMKSGKLHDFFTDAAKTFCVPENVLLAISQTEAGGTWGMSDDNITQYSTPEWWNGASGADLCSGYAYDTCAGSNITDCQRDSLSCATGAVVRGPMQFEDQTFAGYKSKIEEYLDHEPDSRNLQDAIYAAAAKIKNDSGTGDTECDSWGEDTVNQVAERYCGDCGTSNGGSAACGVDYCGTVVSLSKEYEN